MINPQWHAFGALAEQYLTLLGLCSIRLLVLMIVFPPTSDSVLQGTVRNGMALVWSMQVALGQQDLLPALHGVYLVELGLKEALIGLALGYAASLVFWAAQGAGAYLDDLTGYNNVQLSNPTNGQETSLTSTLLGQFANAAFWLLGGAMFLLGALYDSYRWWPLTSTVPLRAELLESFVASRTDSLMETIARLSGPLILALLLVDIGFGIIGKAAQKLDLPALSQPLKALLTVLMLALLAGVFVDQVREQLALVQFGAWVKALAAKFQ